MEVLLNVSAKHIQVKLGQGVDGSKRQNNAVLELSMEVIGAVFWKGFSLSLTENV